MDITVDISNITLSTDRLILRTWKESDLADFFQYCSAEGVGEMAGWKRHETIEDSQKILQSFMTQKCIFAIEYKQNNKVIGSLGLHESWVDSDEKFSHLKAKDIGYVLSKDYWGQGLMPEAVKAVINFCFLSLKLDAVTCCHFLTNNQSRRVIEKCGFTYVKCDQFFAKQLNKLIDDKKYILFNQS